MEKSRERVALISDSITYAKEYACTAVGPVYLGLMTACWIGSAIMYALLEIAEAIREHNKGEV